MANAISRDALDAFYKGYFHHDAGKVADFLHDDVTWTINGPVDVLPYCGVHHGKRVVLDLIGRVVPSVFRVFKVVQELVLIDRDRVSTLNRLSGERSDGGRVISYRLAHFMRLRDGKVIENISLMDSFDAVEQLLDHPLAAQAGRQADCGNLVAL
jgi:ketosteroid isomerase-like protein